MIFEEGYIYHIYNQGNNKQKVFFSRDNYLFFLRKIRTHLLPYVDVLAYCLMPNHFHLMVLVRRVSVKTVGVTGSHADSKRMGTVGVTPSDTDSSRSDADSDTPSDADSGKVRTLNDSIGILLRSYTRAVNIKLNRSGKLFREKTKSECINCPQGLAPSFFTENGVTVINVELPERQYPQVCFKYIHLNPVRAGLVSKPEEWEFSSAPDYAGVRNGTLINRKVAGEYVDTKV